MAYISKSKKRKPTGFTLVEAMVALGLSSLVIAGLTSSFIQYRRMIKSQDIQTELQGNVRAAMQLVTESLNLTGYGLDMPDSQLSSWITWVSNFDTNPKISDGDSGDPDSVMLAGAFSSRGSLAAGMSDSNHITLHSGEGLNFNTSDKKLIYVGGLELARITAISGNTLTVSTHPSLSAGLHNTYPSGTAVELIEVREFSIDSDGGPMGEPALLLDRHYTISDFSEFFNTLYYNNVMAVGIENMQISTSALDCEVSITGVALDPDLSYKDEINSLRRFELKQHVLLRNMHMTMN